MKQPPPPPFLSPSASTAAWVGFTADTLLAIGLMLVLFVVVFLVVLKPF